MSWSRDLGLSGTHGNYFVILSIVFRPMYFSFCWLLWREVCNLTTTWLKHILYEGISHHSTLCKDVWSDPSSTNLFDFFPSLFLLPLYWKQQWPINVYSLSPFQSLDYRTPSIAFSCLFFTQRNTNLLSCSFYRSSPVHLIRAAFPVPFPSPQCASWEKAVSDLCTAITALPLLVFIIFQ